ncbi:MAG: adenosine deaminase [Bacillota bacterium]
MNDINLARQAELHVHTVGCYTPEDLFAMAKDHYREINWNRFSFLDRYERIFGVRLDPVAVFERACATGSLDEIRQIAIYSYHPDGTFDEFNIKSYFPQAIVGYYLDKGEHEPILAPLVERHKSEGLKLVEYRNAFGARGEEFKDWHGRYARFLKNAATKEFKARYVVRLVGDPVECYGTLRELLDEQPDLVETIVGVDFSGKEIPPKQLMAFYERLKQDHDEHPDKALDAVVHIGENYLTISLESAIRWCHQSALYGASRLGHCIALGLDPYAAVQRHGGSHLTETVEERMDQIEYDLAHAEGLRAYGITVDREALEKEYAELTSHAKDETVTRPYDQTRLSEAARRQDYVLDDLARLGTAIETCPTSNLCIGGVPNIESHPFKKLYASKVKLVVCTDDPGIFGITLSDEIDNLTRWFGIDPQELAERLGDPREYRLGKERLSAKK